VPYGNGRILAEVYCWVITQEAEGHAVADQVPVIIFELHATDHVLTQLRLAHVRVMQIRFALVLPKRLRCVSLAVSVLY